jgi:hypothetical protein
MNQVNLRKVLAFITVSALLLAGLAACEPPETELSFETMEQESSPGSIKQWEGKEPKLLIIASAQDIEEAKPFVTDDGLAMLQQMDFTTHFAVLAFRGLQGSSHAGFRIERIIRRGNEVALYAQPGNIGGQPQESSPYHLVTVKKEGNWDADYTFNLYFAQADAAVVSTTHHVP